MNYYNENDPHAAAWLLGLIEDGLIPQGHVDARSIEEVRPADLVGYAQCHFFAGIGGWPLALRLSGWPEDRPVWTASCPCQPFSNSGKRQGESDSRHLWPVVAGLIAICKPPEVFGEQVASKLGRLWLSRVRSDLEGMAYGVGAADLCSASVGAPNIRQRLYWMAVSECSERREKFLSREDVVYRDDSRREKEAGGLELYKPAIGMEITTGTGLAWPAGKELYRRLGRPSESRSEVGVAHPLGNANCAGLQGRFQCGQCAGEQSSWPSGAWSEFDVVQCRDGKSRRIPKGSLESGLQCMAHGLQPGVAPLWHQGYPLSWEKIESRVSLLKGIGNAINPYIAAEFIRAAMQAIDG